MATPPNRTVLVFDHDNTFSQFESHLPFTTVTDPHRFANGLSSLADRMAGGASPTGTVVTVIEGGTCASGVLTMTGQPTASQTVTVAGQQFTAVSSGAAGNQFNIGSTFPVTAQNLVNAVNASSACDASASLVASGTIAFYAEVPGQVGDNYTYSTTMSNATTVSGAFTGGVDGTFYNFHYGK